ncbi:MAG: MerR family transcriptional regulator [Gammaproteobacteria bacterium]|nr:MerR family transcriptional regulator [Gammaproteobacteria bacterium]
MLIASSNKSNKIKVELPPIPGKTYFSIGEVSDLCAVKPHVLRYWEQEFPQLKPSKRRGNRRYYQQHDVLMIREIRDLLYDQGFTIGGARQKLLSQSNKVSEIAPDAKPSQHDTKLVSELCHELEDLLLVLS